MAVIIGILGVEDGLVCLFLGLLSAAVPAAFCLLRTGMPFSGIEELLCCGKWALQTRSMEHLAKWSEPRRRMHLAPYLFLGYLFFRMAFIGG